MKIGHILFTFVFSKLRIRVLEGHCQCVRMINKNRILKNRSCERAFIELLREVSSGADETPLQVR